MKNVKMVDYNNQNEKNEISNAILKNFATHFFNILSEITLIIYYFF